MADVGISMMLARSSREWIQYCRVAETVGISSAWGADSLARDCYLDACLALSHTTTLPVGVAVALPTRTPLQTARIASSLAEWGNRFTVGFGAGHSAREGAKSLKFFELVRAGAMEDAHGIPFFPAVSRIRDYHDCVTGLLRAPLGEPVEIVREHFRAAGTGFGLSRAALPIILGAFAPRMVQLAGEIADGVSLHHIAPRKVISARLDLARAAHAASPKAKEPFKTAFSIMASIHDDDATAMRRARAELVGAFAIPPYLSRLAEIEPGVAAELEELIEAERYQEAADAIPDEIVRDIVLVSTPTRARDDLAAISEADLVRPLPVGNFGALLGDALGEFPREGVEARFAVVRALLGEVVDAP
jgi:alkanesulfonate monooxygenase SsuD/methylene tetrahydromethanopterin reductase-like flavin-dependent oxidoreductase (luciferase family)